METLSLNGGAETFAILWSIWLELFVIDFRSWMIIWNKAKFQAISWVKANGLFEHYSFNDLCISGWSVLL